MLFNLQLLSQKTSSRNPYHRQRLQSVSAPVTQPSCVSVTLLLARRPGTACFPLTQYFILEGSSLPFILSLVGHKEAHGVSRFCPMHGNSPISPWWAGRTPANSVPLFLCLVGQEASCGQVAVLTSSAPLEASFPLGRAIECNGFHSPTSWVPYWFCFSNISVSSSVWQ